MCWPLRKLLQYQQDKENEELALAHEERLRAREQALQIVRRNAAAEKQAARGRSNKTVFNLWKAFSFFLDSSVPRFQCDWGTWSVHLFHFQNVCNCTIYCELQKKYTLTMQAIPFGCTMELGHWSLPVGGRSAIFKDQVCTSCLPVFYSWSMFSCSIFVTCSQTVQQHPPTLKSSGPQFSATYYVFRI